MKKNETKSTERFGRMFKMTGILVLGLAAVLQLVACSDDDEKGTTLTFPTPATLYVEAGTTQTLTFSVKADWTLTSNAAWCTFDGELTTYGAAGDNAVTITISDDGQSLTDETQASITMTLAGESQEVWTIIRAEAGIKLTAVDSDGDEVEALTAGYSSCVYYTFTATFEFAVASYPEWLEFDGTLHADAKEEVTVGFKAVDVASYFKYAQKGKIELANPDGSISFDFAITYPGMDEDAIVVEGPTRSVWNWTVSGDGTTFTQSETEYTPKYTISALNDDYVLAYVDCTYDGNWEYGVDTAYDSATAYTDVDWIHATDDGEGTVTLSVDELASGSRSAYVLAFPRALYDSIKDDLDAAVCDEYGDLDEIFQQYNTLIAFTQEAEGADDNVLFKVCNGQTLEEYTVYSEYSGMYASIITGGLANFNWTGDVAYMPYEVGPTYIVAPAPLSTSNEWGWNGWTYYTDGWETDGDGYVTAEGGSSYYYNGVSYPATSVKFYDDPYEPILCVFTEDDMETIIRILVFYPN